MGTLDMAGNVWEWCSDQWHSHYRDAPADGQSWLANPEHPGRENAPWLDLDAEDYRVIRGGCYLWGADLIRSAFRSSSGPGCEAHVGFRIVARHSPARLQRGNSI